MDTGPPTDVTEEPAITETSAPIPSVLTPATKSMDPPVFPSPPAMLTRPAGPELPGPLESETSPLASPEPLPTETEPLVPDGVAPLLNAAEPPEPPALPPDDTSTDPPTDEDPKDSPANSCTDPASVLDDPADMNTLAPFPPVDAPAATVILPATLASPVASCTPPDSPVAESPVDTDTTPLPEEEAGEPTRTEPDTPESEAPD